MIWVVKRDGTKVPYNLEKIATAIAGAFSDFNKEFSDASVLDCVEEKIFNN